MNGFPIPSLKIAMIWLFGIMFVCFIIGGVLIVLESENPDNGPYKNYDFRIPSEDLDKIRMNLEIDTGSLNLTSNEGPDLVIGKVSIEGLLPEPRLEHTITNGTSNIAIERSKNIMHEIIGGEENWYLNLKNDTPTSLLLTVGVGDINFTSGSMKLTDLGIDNGAGSVYLDLHKWTGPLLKVNIDNGVGDLTLILPETADINVVRDQGMGNSVFSGFTADERGFTHKSTLSDASVIDVHISQGLGDLNLKTLSPDARNVES